MLKTWGPEHKATPQKPRGPLHADSSPSAGGAASRGPAGLILLARTTQCGTSHPSCFQELPRPWGGGKELCRWGQAMLWGAHHGQEPGSRRDHGLCPPGKKRFHFSKRVLGAAGVKAGREGQAGGRRWLMPFAVGTKEVQRRSGAPTPRLGISQ